MNKVENIHLNGRAYTLEQAAYSRLEHYLARARKTLHNDPDQAEVMRDFEQAIAEKCDLVLTARKTVVTSEEMERIIEAMGPVEPSEHELPHEVSEAHTPKRFYTLKEGSIVGGICTGAAAYFNIDVTVMRLIFIILTLATSGGWILVYLVLLLVVPEAKTPEEKAALRGERFTAQDLLARAQKKYGEVSDTVHWKQVARDSKPALSSAGAVLVRVMKIMAMIIALSTLICLMLATIMWVVALWTLLMGSVALTDQLSTISPWAIATAVTAGYMLFAVPFAAVSWIFWRLAKAAPSGRPATGWLIGGAVIWMVALTTLICITVAVGPRVDEYRRSHGYVRIEDRDAICINASICETPLHEAPDAMARPAY